MLALQPLMARFAMGMQPRVATLMASKTSPREKEARNGVLSSAGQSPGQSSRTPSVRRKNVSGRSARRASLTIRQLTYDCLVRSSVLRHLGFRCELSFPLGLLERLRGLLPAAATPSRTAAMLRPLSGALPWTTARAALAVP